ncbi:MAG: heme o synthase [Anaerolineae bacterium]
MAHAQTQTVLNDRPVRRFFASVVVLFKLRIVILLLFSSIGGLMLAAHGRPDMGDLLLLTLTGTMSAAGASALNQVLELESDARMRRTQRRPMARGEYRPTPVVAVSLALVAGAVALALATGNLTLAFFLGLGAFIYVVIYTVVLKPRTPLNIVLGGAAGSCAVLAGSAAAGHWADPGAVLLAALVFAWTPTHFWSLSLVYREDYVRAGVPMLPAVVEAPRAAFWMLVHALFTGGIALLMVTHETLGLIYLVPVGLATASLVRGSLRLFRRPERDQAIEVFKGSNLYLAVALLAICVDTLLVL